MAQKNKHAGAKLRQHKAAQKKATVNKVTSSRRTVNERAADAVARQGVTTPGLVRDELIRQRLMQAPQVPDVTAFGLEERGNVVVEAEIIFTVKDYNIADGVGPSVTRRAAVPWNDGPIALGLHLSGLLGEVTKEVWGLNKTGTDESKPTEEN